MKFLFGYLPHRCRINEGSNEGPSSIRRRCIILCMSIIEFVEKGLNISNHCIVTWVRCCVDAIQLSPHINLKIPWLARVRNHVGEGIQVEELIQHCNCFISECWRERNCGEAVLNRRVRSYGNGVASRSVSEGEVAIIPLNCPEVETANNQTNRKEEGRGHVFPGVSRWLARFQKLNARSAKTLCSGVKRHWVW